MLSAILLGIGLVTATPPGARSSSDGPTTYEEAREAVGRGSEAHVRLAIWCESRGMDVGRREQLGLAVLSDPKNVAARGLMGQVSYRDRWRHPEEVAESVRVDPDLSKKLDEYEARRGPVGNRADQHWALALWCREVGLDVEAEGHLAAVTRLDPSRAGAWIRLGYQRHGDRWLLPDRIAAEVADAKVQELADKEWRPRFDRWKAALSEQDRRAPAEAELAGLTDPRAVPMIEKVLVEANLHCQHGAILALRNIDSPASTRALARLAVHGHSDQVRRDAIARLAGRDPGDFVGQLLDQLRDPIRMAIVPVTGPGSTGELFVEGRTFREDRFYHSPPLPHLRLAPGPDEYLDLDALGLPCIVHVTTKSEHVPSSPGWNNRVIYTRFTVLPVGRAMVQAEREASEVKHRQQHDIRHVKHLNATRHADNGRVVDVLKAVSGKDLGVDSSEPWRAWWAEHRGYRYLPSPTDPSTVVTEITPRHRRPVVPYAFEDVSFSSRRQCCFAARTPVWTLAGRRPIEAIRVGDRVLTEDVSTGGLAYRPVMAVDHNPPDRTKRVATADGKSIACTDLHRFWKIGEGWAMARDLKPDDVIRTIGGTARVASIEDGPVQPTFNLETVGGDDYFAGEAGLLAHDNSPVRPTPRPFDARPTFGATLTAR